MFQLWGCVCWPCRVRPAPSCARSPHFLRTISAPPPDHLRSSCVCLVVSSLFFVRAPTPHHRAPTEGVVTGLVRSWRVQGCILFLNRVPSTPANVLNRLAHHHVFFSSQDDGFTLTQAFEFFPLRIAHTDAGANSITNHLTEVEVHRIRVILTFDVALVLAAQSAAVHHQVQGQSLGA